MNTIESRLWSIVNRHYKRKDDIDRYELLRNKRIHNGKIIGDLIVSSPDRTSLKWLMTNHNNDIIAVSKNKGNGAMKEHNPRKASPRGEQLAAEAAQMLRDQGLLSRSAQSELLVEVESIIQSFIEKASEQEFYPCGCKGEHTCH